MDNLAAIFGVVRKRLKVDLKAHTVKLQKVASNKHAGISAEYPRFSSRITQNQLGVTGRVTFLASSETSSSTRFPRSMQFPPCQIFANLSTVSGYRSTIQHSWHGPRTGGPQRLRGGTAPRPARCLEDLRCHSPSGLRPSGVSRWLLDRTTKQNLALCPKIRPSGL
jgi:hypothetical protein